MISLPTLSFSQQLSPWDFDQKETLAYFEGMHELQTTGWGSLNSRVTKVTTQLVKYSGQVFKVVPGQTFQWGQAHAGGWIILDISSVSSPEPILAFRLAHEWGHEALGHQPNWYHPAGKQWTFRPSNTTAEDEADAYAGRFLARFGYPLDPVISELKSLPKTSHGDSHSDGVVRAKIVSDAYKTAIQFRSEDSLCRSMEKVFSGGKAFLKKTPFDNKKIFEGFYCEPNANGRSLDCAGNFENESTSIAFQQNFILGMKSCLPSDFKYSKVHVFQSWVNAATGQNIGMKRELGDDRIEFSIALE